MRLALVILLSCVAAVSPASAMPLVKSYAPYMGKLAPDEQHWFSAAFVIYKRGFIKADGRVFDPQNGGVTHSESQGYGMLLALLGSDPATFDQIWHFSRNNLQRRDGLFAWKWVPGRGIDDRNNATDGDIMIATALALAGLRWNREEYIREAKRIAEAVGDRLIIRHGGYTLLLPGEWAKPTPLRPRPILNLSYFIPLSLPLMESLSPRHDWEGVMRDGNRILDQLVQPPSDWSQLDETGAPIPASGFPRTFSYDAVRIPIYLLQFGQTNRLISRYLMEIWGEPHQSEPFTFDVTTLARKDKFWDSAYQFSYELMRCAETGEPVSLASTNMKMVNYFATSLHLMALAAMYANYPHCFPQQYSLAQR